METKKEEPTVMEAEDKDDEDEDEEEIEEIKKEEPKKPSLTSRVRAALGGKSSDEETEDKEEGSGNLRPLPERGSRLDIPNPQEASYRAKLARLITQFSGDPEARVALYRIEPERWRGESVKGYVDRWDLSRFKSMEDLLETIEVTYGGKYWEIKIQTPNENGSFVYKGQARFHIAADPIPKKVADAIAAGANGGSGANGSGPVIHTPDKVLVEMMQKEHANNLKFTQAALAEAKEEATELRKMIEKQRSEFETRANTMLTQGNGMTLQTVERTWEKYSEERRNLVETHSKEMAHVREMHARDLDNERRGRDNDRQNFTMQLETERRLRENDKTAIEERWRSQMDNQKTLFETQINNLNTLYTTQISNQKTQLESIIENLKERNRLLETKVEDAEKRVKAELDRRLVEAEHKPNSIESLKETMDVVSGAAGMLGFSKQSSAPPEPKSDAVMLMEAAHKTGLVDKGVAVLGKVAEMMRPPAPPPQPPIINMPVNPLTGQPIFFGNGMGGMSGFQAPPQVTQQPHQHVVHQAPAVQQPARESSGPPQPAPRQAPVAAQTQPVTPEPAAPIIPTEVDPAVLKGIVDNFNNALDSGLPAKDFAEQIAMQPVEFIRPILNEGVGEFQKLIQHVDPESSLLSIRGKKYLVDLFNNVSKLIEGR